MPTTLPNALPGWHLFGGHDTAAGFLDGDELLLIGTVRPRARRRPGDCGAVLAYTTCAARAGACAGANLTGVIATETHTAVSAAAATADTPDVVASIGSAELVRHHQNAPSPATVDTPDR